MKYNIKLFIFALILFPITVFSQDITNLEGHWTLSRAVITNTKLDTNKADSIVYLYDTPIYKIEKNSFFVKDIIKGLNLVNLDKIDLEDDLEKKSYLSSDLNSFEAEVEVNGNEIVIRDPRDGDDIKYEFTYQLISSNRLLLKKNSITFKDDSGKKIEQNLKIYLEIK